MIVTTTEYVPNRDVSEILGVIYGNTVRAKHVGKDIMAGLKSIVGGEITGYSEMLTESRNKATARLIESAQAMGADAVINVRYTTSSVMQGMSEVLAYGTAVKLSG